MSLRTPSYVLPQLGGHLLMPTMGLDGSRGHKKRAHPAGTPPGRKPAPTCELVNDRRIRGADSAQLIEQQLPVGTPVETDDRNPGDASTLYQIVSILRR